MCTLSLEDYAKRLKKMKEEALEKAEQFLEVGEVGPASDCLDLIRTIDDRLDNM